ncbi:MAG: hypothetical protein GF393_02230 [Armatimonadia bacterium]|nr:hypothetical protein [Armatimonadia bacterium]
MRRRSTALTALIPILILGGCLAASAQSVRFVTPQDGDTVRDMVRIQATKQSPNEGWISYKIEGGGEGDFVSAVTAPFIYPWDTRARDEDGKDIYQDGQYTLTAVALNTSGRKVGEASITVTLKNSVSTADAPQRVDLRLFYDRNDEVYYRAEGEWSIRPDSGEEEPEDVYEIAKVFNGALVSNWKNKVMSPTYAAGHAVLHVVVGSSGARAGKSDVVALDHAGEALTYIALKNGQLRPKHSDEPHFELAELTIPLRDRAVKVGDSWQGRIEVWPDPLKGTGATGGGMGGEMGMGMGPEMGMDPAMGMGMPGMDMGMEGGMEGGGAASGETQPPTKLETTRVRATHSVEGYEWVMGYPTVRIRSTFSEDKAKVTVPSGPSGGATGGMGEEFGGPVGEPGMGMGFGDEMMGMPGGGMGGGAGQGAEKDSSYVGERMTYWSWDLQRPLRIVDNITHTLEIERAAQGGMGMEGMGMGMEGMPMEGAMPPGMMEPGMPGEAPGMEPGMMPPGMEPGMEPGMGPGMGGFGMEGGMGMQQEPAEPMKVKIRVKLTIQEVNL